MIGKIAVRNLYNFKFDSCFNYESVLQILKEKCSLSRKACTTKIWICVSFCLSVTFCFFKTFCGGISSVGSGVNGECRSVSVTTVLTVGYGLGFTSEFAGCNIRGVSAIDNDFVTTFLIVIAAAAVEVVVSAWFLQRS